MRLNGDSRFHWQPLDFAWIGRELKIGNNGKVLVVIKIVHYD
jgi:hypothetical protein